MKSDLCDKVPIMVKGYEFGIFSIALTCLNKVNTHCEKNLQIHIYFDCTYGKLIYRNGGSNILCIILICILIINI